MQAALQPSAHGREGLARPWAACRGCSHAKRAQQAAIRRSSWRHRPARTVVAQSGPVADATSTAAPTSVWVQKIIELPPYKRGCHVITRKLLEHIPELAEFEVGLANLFIQHTSASLTINENASPDVPLDLNDALDKLAPEGQHYRHLDEGLDDMPAHVKSSLMGPSLTIPIQHGRLCMGIWQGIYLNEHRNYGGPRRVVITLQGQRRADGRKYSGFNV